jgi:nucleoside-diphosphate-sugar epimerase
MGDVKAMKILITGNMGYVGSSVVERLSFSYPQATLIGLDMGSFANCLANTSFLPDCRVDVQHFADVRKLPAFLLDDVSAVVHLAAISNDPMGNSFESVTYDINYHSSIELARKAKACGVGRFVFASSCSMYGMADDNPRREESILNPLTAYAKSKAKSEEALRSLADENFLVTSLRFATACGMSDRLRLDLVLNDFVACAATSGQITVLSDGTPWRPLIHVRDMARAIDWAVARDIVQGGVFLAVNVGSNQWNYQVKDLAEAVAAVVPGVSISINKNARPDLRSYRVNFDRFSSLAPDHLPQVDLFTAIKELTNGLDAMGFHDMDFRNSRFMRLNVLAELRTHGFLTEQLEWNFKHANGTVT